MRGLFCSGALLLLLTSCGYRFTAPGGALPHGVRAVQIPVMANVTPEPSAETYFTQALREHALRAGTLGGEAAEASIVGTVLGVSAALMLVTPGTSIPPTYRLTATVELRLVRNGVVLAQTQVSGEEDVVPGPASSADRVIAQTESNRQAALRRVADALMKEGYERLCSGW